MTLFPCPEGVTVSGEVCSQFDDRTVKPDIKCQSCLWEKCRSRFWHCIARSSPALQKRGRWRVKLGNSKRIGLGCQRQIEIYKSGYIKALCNFLGCQIRQFAVWHDYSQFGSIFLGENLNSRVILAPDEILRRKGHRVSFSRLLWVPFAITTNLYAWKCPIHLALQQKSDILTLRGNDKSVTKAARHTLSEQSEHINGISEISS